MSDGDKSAILSGSRGGEIVGVAIIVAGLFVAVGGVIAGRDPAIIGHGVLLVGIGAGLYGGSEAIMMKALK